MELVDTHCHLNHRDFDEDREAVLQRAIDADVRRLLVIGYDLASSRRAVEMAKPIPTPNPSLKGRESANPAPSSEGESPHPLFAVIGIHPESADEWTPNAQAELSALLQSAPERVVAYGEIGLDYHWETIPRDRQQVVFAEQIAFAEALSLPIIIHCRDAMDDVLAVLKESRTTLDVVMHCFTGNTEAASLCLDAGYYLGIGGVATFKKTDDVRAAVAYAPSDRILLETDCPYLAPQKWRGRRNEPSYMTAVAETVAAVKGLMVEEVAAVTTANAERVFRLVQ